MSTPTPPDPDTSLDREERELAARYRHLPKAEPDAALDARVLAAAERAVAGKPHPRARWLLGLASVATVVMAAGLTWHLYGQGPGRQPAPSAAAPRHGYAGSANEVVPVHVLSAREAQAPSAKMTAPQAANAAALAAPPPPPPAMAKASTMPTPRTAQELIAQARIALSHEDESRARAVVQRIVRQYPDLKLPADLVPYAPTGQAGKGSP